MVRSTIAHLALPDPEDPRRRRARMLVCLLVGSCAGCGRSGLDHDLYPVADDHLTFFAGDELCRFCAARHGVL